MLHVPGSVFPPGLYPETTPARLVRAENLRPLVHGSPIATMYISRTGGGIRRLIGTAHRHVVAMRRDPQMKFGQPTEGIVEGPAAQRCATDPDIPFYQTQPFRLVLPYAGKLGSYIADILYVTSDGTVWVREIKRRLADLMDPDYQAKLEAVCWLIARLGWKFRPWIHEEVLGNVERQVNVATIYFDRAASLDGLMPRFEEIAASTPIIPFGELILALDSRNMNRARAAVHRLIMQGRVWADLDLPLEAWTDVRLRAAPAPAMNLPLI